MPVINPFDETLLSINDKFSVLTEKANTSRAVKYGDAQYTKTEARSKLMRELASKQNGADKIELIKKNGVDASMNLLVKGGSL